MSVCLSVCLSDQNSGTLWPIKEYGSIYTRILFRLKNMVQYTRILFRLKNVVRYTRMDSGGYYPALENPRRLQTDIFAFVKQVQSKTWI